MRGRERRHKPAPHFLRAPFWRQFALIRDADFRSPVTTALKLLGGLVLLLVILFGLAVTIVPRFLDRIYYRGPASDHYDGERFHNVGGEEETFAPPSGTGSRAGFFWRYLTGSDGRPPWPATVPVTPGTPVPRVEGDAMVATWVGHATVLVQTGGLNILTDPVWSDRTGPFARGPKRVAAPGIRFDDLPRIDLVLLSHNHYDHLDLPTLKRLWARDKPMVVTSLGNDAILRANGIEARALDWGQETGLWRTTCPPNVACETNSPVRVRVTRNHHWGSRWFRDRNRALWSSFVVKLPGGNLFFAGDTGLGDGKWPVEAAAYGPIRLAIIPIGAFRFTPGQMSSSSHIGPAQAVQVLDGLRASAALPIHWGTFRLSFEQWETPPAMLDLLMRCAGGTPDRFARRGFGVPWQVPPLSEQPALDLSKLTACAHSPEVRALQ